MFVFLQLELFCLQLSFLLLTIELSVAQRHFRIVSKKASIVRTKAPIVKKHSKVPIASKQAASSLQDSSGNKRPAFGKPCRCPRDTRHFRRVCRFTGSEEQKPCFTG